jgi:predicted component of type VI protein secretion system
MKNLIYLFLLTLIISGCASSTPDNTPTAIMHQIKYVYASNDDSCMGEITIQKSATETAKLVLFPNGSAAEITVFMKDGDKAWMQADYMTSTKDTPCDVICRITLDGVLWKEAKSTGTKGARMVCEGIVGEK